MRGSAVSPLDKRGFSPGSSMTQFHPASSPLLGTRGSSTVERAARRSVERRKGCAMAVGVSGWRIRSAPSVAERAHTLRGGRP